MRNAIHVGEKERTGTRKEAAATSLRSTLSWPSRFLVPPVVPFPLAFSLSRVVKKSRILSRSPRDG